MKCVLSEKLSAWSKWGKNGISLQQIYQDLYMKMLNMLDAFKILEHVHADHMLSYFLIVSDESCWLIAQA